jgi:hypothetical protein
MLCVVLSVKTLIVVMLSVALLSVVIPGAIMLNVVESFTRKINCKLQG